jgi:hypothetical protein
MDLNELLSRHQIALIRANQAGTGGERRQYNAEADCFASKVLNLQGRLGAHASRLLPSPCFSSAAL